eukprot:1264923-Rhodomonas_salina.1
MRTRGCSALWPAYNHTPCQYRTSSMIIRYVNAAHHLLPYATSVPHIPRATSEPALLPRKKKGRRKGRGKRKEKK